MPFRDDGVDIEITADDRKARPAIERTNSSLERIEKTAAKMADAIGRSMNTLMTILTRVAEMIGVLYVMKQAYDGLTGAMFRTDNAGAKLVNTYRGARLAFSPTALTVYTIGLGIAAEAAIRLTLAEARLIDQQALLAKRSKISFEDVRSLSFSSRSMGLASDFWAKAAKGMDWKAIKEQGIDTRNFTGGFRSSADVLRDVAVAYEELRDPVERAALAIAVFGDEAETVMPKLDQRLIDNIDTARQWGIELTKESRTAALNFKRDFGEIAASFATFGNQFSAFAEVIKQKVIYVVAGANEIRRGILPQIEQAERYNAVTGERMFADIPGLSEIEARMRAGGTKMVGPFLPGQTRPLMGQYGVLPPVPGVPSGNIFGGLAARASYMASKEGLQARLGDLSGRRSAIMGNFEFGPAVASAALVSIEREMRVIEARIKAIEKQEENLRKEEALVQKLGTIEYKEGDVPDWVTGRRRAEPSLLVGPGGQPRTGAAITPEDRLQRAMMLAQIWTERNQMGPGMNDLQARYDQNIKATERFQERALAYQIKAVELTAGPGGELSAVEKIYQLRLAASRTQEEIAEAGFDREERLLEVQKRRFDELRSSFEGLFDAAFSGARGFWDAVKRMALSVFLTPVKRALSGWLAGALMGQGGASGGGLAGALGSFGAMAGGFGGGVTAGSPLTYATGAGMESLALHGGGAAMGAGSGLGSFASSAGGIGLMAKMAGIGPMLALGGAGLVAGGISRRNTNLGLAMGAGGGALAAIGLGMMFGGPIGALIGAGIGLGAVLISRLWKTAEQKVIDKVQQLYGIRIDRSLAAQIVEMGKSQFGGNLDMAVRAPAIRDLIELYSMATGQGMRGLAVKQFPTTFSQSGGVLSQQPNYWNGMPYSPPMTTGLGGGQMINVNLDPQATREFLSGRMATAIIQNPRTVGAAVVESGRQSVGRRELIAQGLQPSLVLA